MDRKSCAFYISAETLGIQVMMVQRFHLSIVITIFITYPIYSEQTAPCPVLVQIGYNKFVLWILINVIVRVGRIFGFYSCVLN